ncbi:hypothetical protein LguiA_000749 [Lonicera macranthoides]
MICFNGRSWLMYLRLSLILCTFLVPSFGEFVKFHHQPKADGSLSFLVIGDWGRRGFYNQSEVATQMGKVGEKLDIDFVISTGDNFYDDGLKGVDDPAFEESFKNIYTAKSLQKPWYSVLGNHDYRGDVEAQLSPVLRQIDSRWLCLRSFVLHAEIVEFFFVDTTPFVDLYFTDPKDHVYDWEGINPRGAYLATLLGDLAKALNESTAKWKIVVGHHAIRSTGHHGDTHELVVQLLPILKAYNVDFYMNGHDHSLEHISCRNSSIQFLTSGAGSKAWMTDYKKHYQCDVKYFHLGQGFMSVLLTKYDAKIVFYDVFGKVGHQLTASKSKQQLHSST